VWYGKFTVKNALEQTGEIAIAHIPFDQACSASVMAVSGTELSLTRTMRRMWLLITLRNQRGERLD